MVKELEQMRGVEQIAHPEIAELEDPLVDLSRQVLLNGTHYDLIIGDDTSGRIPTLILSRVLRTIYESAKERKPQVRFVRGRKKHYEETQHEIDRVLAGIGTKPDVALVVTEYVETGDRLASITTGLQSRGIDCDIAALFTYHNPRHFEERVIKNGSRAYYHMVRGEPVIPNIWGKERLTGLLRCSDVDWRVLSNPYYRSQVNIARRDVKIMAERVLRQL